MVSSGRGGRDVPGYVKQEEGNKNKSKAQVRGTLKATVL